MNPDDLTPLKDDMIAFIEGHGMLEAMAAEFREFSGAESFGLEMDKLDRLFLQTGKLGHIELAFAHQGVLDTIGNLQELIDPTYDDSGNGPA